MSARVRGCAQMNPLAGLQPDAIPKEAHERPVGPLEDPVLVTLRGTIRSR